MEDLSRTTLSHLDDLAVRHIVDHLDMTDVTNLCSSSRSVYRLLHDMYTISLSFPLDNNYMIKDEAEKPVLAILTNGTTDKDCQSNTNKQIAKINIGNLKLLRLLCPNEEDEDCINSCSNYHQRILYNLYHRHWKRGTSFNLQSLRITVSEKVRRVSQVVSAMPALVEVDLHIPINTDEHVVLIEDVCSHPSIRKVSVTILLKTDHLRGFTLKLKSENLEELTLTGAGGLPVTKVDLPKLQSFRFLPQSRQEVAKLLAGANSTMSSTGFTLRFDFTEPMERLKLMHQQCPSLQFYNDVYIGDVCRDDFQDWARTIAERMYQDSC